MNASEEPPEWQRTWHGLFDILGCKRTVYIIRLLSIEAQGFDQMERRLDGITSTVLSRRLEQLEGRGSSARRSTTRHRRRPGTTSPRPERS